MELGYDVIVVGGGIIGLGAAYYLAKCGCKTVILEQFSIPNSRGSSHGHSRLFKLSHLKEFACKIQPKAKEMWKEVERESGISILLDTGHLTITHSSENYKLEALIKVLQAQQLDFKSYCGHEIEENFPGLHFSKNFSAFFESNGMLLKADKCIEALKKEFLKHGGCICEEEEVLNVQQIKKDHVIVHSSKKAYSCRSVILACGPWINKLMNKIYMPLPTQTVRVVAYFWKETIPGTYSVLTNNFPPLMVLFPKYHLYSTPCLEYPGLIKICYHYRCEVDPDLPNVVMPKDEILEEERLMLLKRMISDHFPFLETEPVLKETYLQTVTPNSTPIIDRHPFHPNIVIAAGFSGYGFGIATSVGEILGKLATSQTQEYSDEPFSFQNCAKL